MDLNLLVIFLLASCWLYAAVLLALQDWRWNMGQIAQYCLCATFGAWLVLARHWDREWTYAVCLLFAATVLAPFFMRLQVRSLLLHGRLRGAWLAQYIVCLLTWRAPSRVFGVLPDADRLREPASRDPANMRAYGRLLAAVFAATSRRAFIAARIDINIAARDYPAAVRLFDEHFVAGGLKPNATLLYTMVVAHSELRDLPRAAAALQRALGCREPFNPYGMRRFMAMLRVYAMAGCVEDVEALFEREKELTALVPPAYPYLWAGVALINAGETETGIDALTEAIARVRVGEDRIREMIERHLWAPPDQNVVTETSSETREILAAVRHSYEQSRSSVRLFDYSRSVVVTWGLIMACVCVWLLTEWVGSSTSVRTLVRFGANVPALVMQGEWWRLLSSVFLHVGGLHLFFNAYGCYLFGTFVERASGRWAMFVVFLVSGIAGSALSALLGAYGVAGGALGVSAGASGAVFGLLGAATIITLRSPGAFRPGMRRMYVFNFVFIAAINMVFGLVETRIDNLAHGGGFAAGLLLGAFMVTRRSGKTRKHIFRVAGLLLAFLPLIAGVRTFQNVRAGGYSLRVAPLQEHVMQDKWQISTPFFWELVPTGLGQAVFRDPWSDRSQPTLIVAEANEQTVLPMPESDNLSVSAPVQRRIGGSEYSETFVLNTAAEPHTAHFLFETLESGQRYLLGFSCDTDEMGAFREQVVERVLEHFIIQEDLGH